MNEVLLQLIVFIWTATWICCEGKSATKSGIAPAHHVQAAWPDSGHKCCHWALILSNLKEYGPQQYLPRSYNHLCFYLGTRTQIGTAIEDGLIPFPWTRVPMAAKCVNFLSGLTHMHGMFMRCDALWFALKRVLNAPFHSRNCTYFLVQYHTKSKSSKMNVQELKTE